MPRSTDPRNYGPFYEKLSLLMDAGEQDIKLTMNGRLAIYHRNNFYAYINALKTEQSYAFKRKNLDPAEQLDQSARAAYMEGVLRQYLIIINPDPNKQNIADMDVELRFIIRGMDERQKPGIEQLDQLIDQTHAVERVEAHHRLMRQMKHGTVDFKPIVPDSLRTKASPVAHFFGGVKATIDEDMTDELAEEILASAPPDRTDMTDLITQSNQAEPKRLTLSEEAMKAADKLRDKERSS